MLSVVQDHIHCLCFHAGMARHRAISEPVALAEAVNNVIQNSATRSAVDSSTGLTSNHRSITTGDLEWNGAQGGIAISRRFRQQNTCDHIDTTVLDPDADEDTLYDREGEPVYNGQQPRQRDSTSSTSDRTLAAIEEEGTGHDGRPVDATARQKSEGSRGANEKVGQRRWSGTAAQGIDQPGSKESAIRQWKDNVGPLFNFAAVMLIATLASSRSSRLMDPTIRRILKTGVTGTKSSSLCFLA